MATTAFLEQVEQKIYILQNQGKLAEAYDLCKLYLSQYPEERSLHNLKADIEEAIEDANERVVEKKLKEMAPLWDKNEYGKIIKQLKELIKYAPNNKELKKEYQSAQEKYKEQIEEKTNEYKKQQTAKLEKLLQENDQNFVNELYFLGNNNPGNSEVQALVKLYKNKFIEKKLAEKKELMNSEKFDDINNYLSQLEKIDPQSDILKNAKEQIRIKKHQRQNQEKQEFIYQGISHLDTLMKLKKYDKAIKAAQEILDSDKTNEIAEKIIKEAQKKLFTQTREITIEKITASQPQIKSEAKEHKDQYISI